MSDLGYGWTTDGMQIFVPGMNCVHCGRFVGRDGLFNIEYWEMSSEIASLDAEHHECAEAADRRWRAAAVSADETAGT